MVLSVTYQYELSDSWLAPNSVVTTGSDCWVLL